MKIKVLLLVILLVSVLVGCEELGLSKTELSGEIRILNDDLRVGQVLPIALVVDEDLSELHMEIWEITYIEDDTFVNDSIIYSEDMENYMSEDEIVEVFNDSDIEVYNQDDEVIQKYSDKIILFTPDKPGEYLIEVMGYYKTTSPRKVTERSIIILE